MKQENAVKESTKSSNSLTSRLIPVTKWNNFHSWPPIGGLRHLIFYEKKNGFDSCVVRVGRRVLIDESAFFKWAKAGNQNAA